MSLAWERAMQKHTPFRRSASHPRSFLNGQMIIQVAHSLVDGQHPDFGENDSVDDQSGGDKNVHLFKVIHISSFCIISIFALF
jgi:hypothetical protein